MIHLETSVLTETIIANEYYKYHPAHVTIDLHLKYYDSFKL